MENEYIFKLCRSRFLKVQTHPSVILVYTYNTLIKHAYAAFLTKILSNVHIFF